MGRMNRSTHGRIACLTAEIHAQGGTAPDAIQLLPAGTFRATDGRPADAPGWTLTAELAARLIQQASARANPYLIDYEHQTLRAEQNGQPAPAAGWFRRLEWREGSGLWAVGVEWTERARAMIASGEYRFISPVFTYDKAGRVLRLLHAALTNDPALDGMAAVALSFTPDQEQPMNPETLKLLGLAIDATPEQIDAAVAALKTKADEAEGNLAALKANAVPMAIVQELQGQVAALTSAALARDIDDLVKPALADGRLLPAMEAWARDLGKTNLAALKQYLDNAPAIAALTGTQTGGIAPDPANPTLTSEELVACTLLGQNPDDYLNFKATSGAK